MNTAGVAPIAAVAANHWQKQLTTALDAAPSADPAAAAAAVAPAAVPAG
jgi:hypothetical protein